MAIDLEKLYSDYCRDCQANGAFRLSREEFCSQLEAKLKDAACRAAEEYLGAHSAAGASPDSYGDYVRWCRTARKYALAKQDFAAWARSKGEWVSCPICWGRGRHEARKACDACGGAGNQVIERGVEPRPHFIGGQILYDGGKLPRYARCPSCGGSGSKFESWKCSDCDGKGKVHPVLDTRLQKMTLSTLPSRD